MLDDWTISIYYFEKVVHLLNDYRALELKYTARVSRGGCERELCVCKVISLFELERFNGTDYMDCMKKEMLMELMKEIHKNGYINV